MHKTRLISTHQVTHDVKSFRLERPKGFDYKPGDATELALDADNWRDEKRPFTMTSLPDDDTLEFTIKSYPDHGGVTMRLHRLEPGSSLLIDDPFETFRHDSNAVFIAGGAGITPFLALLRSLKKQNRIAGNRLVFANKTRADIIHQEELSAMNGLAVTHVLSNEKIDGYRHGHIDKELLTDILGDNDKRFHVCGPPPMQEAVEKALHEMGFEADSISLSD
ncbi:flavodoxin reductase [Parvularcula flava]|uniref:Flavodoxin reductase n=1 Tax=Aquisalinus luteolus TaxID=1566827 RepID=A0A8J3A3Q8_9PROT|nr:FAD-binding oxidoreductase [Aquisalinus luteolus]NHK28935.1 flavodoxin reductase [Aquisalinus luteolus]GGI00809.1 hypothetical protein GCM10011355_29980 [Aquisalinus luteolus]